MRWVEKISDVYLKCLRIYLICVFALMVVIVTVQIITRYVFGNPLSWTEELSTYLQAALIFPGIAYCVKEHSHVEMTAFYELFPRAVKFVCDLLTNIVLIICGYYFIRSVIVFLGAQKQTALTMPWLRLDVFYLVLLWGAVTCELYLIADAVKFLGTTVRAKGGVK